MKLAFVSCIIIVGIVAVTALPAKGSTKAALKKKPCLQECTTDYKPICAGDGSGKDNKSFGNECVLANFNCENGKSWTVQSQGECPGGGGVRLS